VSIDYAATDHHSPATCSSRQSGIGLYNFTLAGVAFGGLLLGSMAFFVLTPIAYLVACILGVPAYLILRALNCLNVWAFMLVGYVISVCGMSFLMLSISNIDTKDDWLTLLFAPYHLITLFGILWCIAIELVDDTSTT
jgi:hypothetical protein